MARRTVKLALGLLVILLVVPVPARADTNVSGGISTNTTWTAANSPYVVTGTVGVNNGATLTIEPGVVVKFNASTYRLDVNDDSSLVAEGTSALPIEFTSTQDSAPGQWGSVRLSDSSTGTFDYVEMRYGGYGSAYHSNGLINVREDADASVDHSTFLHSDTSGLLANSTEEVLVSHSLFDSNGYGISVVGGAYGVITVTHSAITNNTSHGVFLNWSAAPSQGSIFTYSDIRENGEHGIYASVVSSVPSSVYPMGTNNNILDNPGKQLSPVWIRNDTGGLWDGNYWGENVGLTYCAYASQLWQFHLYYTDEPPPATLAEGPIAATLYSSHTNPVVQCLADKLPIEEWSEDPIDNDSPGV
jgi:hypothetical protein